MRYVKLFFATCGIAAVLAGPASTQTGNGALVVAVCGVLSQQYAVGSTRSITVDVNGRTCS